MPRSHRWGLGLLTLYDPLPVTGDVVRDVLFGGTNFTHPFIANVNDDDMVSFRLRLRMHLGQQAVKLRHSQVSKFCYVLRWRLDCRLGTGSSA